METIEKRLKDINEMQVWKMIKNKGTSRKEIYYMLNTQDGDNINVFETLAELKKYAKTVMV